MYYFNDKGDYFETKYIIITRKRENNCQGGGAGRPSLGLENLPLGDHGLCCSLLQTESESTAWLARPPDCDPLNLAPRTC